MKSNAFSLLEQLHASISSGLGIYFFFSFFGLINYLISDLR